jgi:hypothetical protein
VAVSSGVPFEEWARAAFASGKYHEAQLTAEIVYVAADLPEDTRRIQLDARARRR